MEREKNMSNKVTFITEDNEQVELFIEEQTVINGRTYILAAKDDGSDESEAYILKDISEDDDEQAVYGMVEDDEEMSALAGIFAELLEDTDIIVSGT